MRVWGGGGEPGLLLFQCPVQPQELGQGGGGICQAGAEEFPARGGAVVFARKLRAQEPAVVCSAAGGGRGPSGIGAAGAAVWDLRERAYAQWGPGADAIQAG